MSDDYTGERPRQPESPHDALFRFTFSRPEHAVGELRTILPSELVEHIDFSTLEPLPGSFIDEALAGRASDLLFSVELAGQPALVYVLFEHQSSDDPRMTLRMLGYMLRIWEQHERERGLDAPLPVIIPVVLHHGPGPWRSARRFSELFGLERTSQHFLSRWVPDIELVIDDLAAVDSRSIHERRELTAFARLVLFVLQRARHAPDLVTELEAFVDLIAELLRHTRGLDDFAVLIRYTFWVARVPRERVQRLLRDKVGPMVEKRMMTTAEELIAEGEARGIAKGEAQGEAKGELKGRVATLSKLLTLKFGALPEAAQHRLDTASIAQLDHWTERVLAATKLEDVFGD